ncbi:1,4-alpha-glucan branching protein GlgB [Pseudocolwellia sp. HL-MZ19]|uniref:1,4-alpha-glucan branching protein GlgB n=1 Tax=Pseudocolwellia sp. HL-MZ19 TaxID=3400846 RepID=UPI003CFA3B3C
MNKDALSILNEKTINAIVSAKHEDIFSVLGMHPHPEKTGLIIRNFLPAAKAVTVIDRVTQEKLCSSVQVESSGLFEGFIDTEESSIDYQLLVKYQSSEIVVEDVYRFASLLENDDLYLFGEGTHEQTYQWMGAHVKEVNGIKGVNFVIWAPDARRISVVGDFNFWDGRCHMMRKHPGGGVWDIFIPNVAGDVNYKYEIRGKDGDTLPLKADPYAYKMQLAPQNASVTVNDSDYEWQDKKWMEQRAADSNQYHGPVSIYEVHLGSWRRKGGEYNDYLNYRELAEQLVPYIAYMGFTHVQMMPVSEFPFDGSWGYQPIGMFAPTCRFGSPEDFKYFVDCCHEKNIGVLLDWVPGHFPTDIHGLGKLDGSCLYEHEDLRKGFHPDWKTLIYNYGRAEVVSYLISNALYWLDQFHIDGLRVDAVASMLYLDYSREADEWVPNIHGGRENLEAIELLRQVNSRAYFNYPGVMMVAEESTAWPGVSKPVSEDGLGFGFKWNMGWMNDTLKYMERDPLYRQHHHNELTFGLVYGFSENFILPLSHDEVVHGKRSLLEKMPGDDWQKFANLRAYYGFMWTHPGKKLLFMGCEFAQRDEWNHDQSLDWHLLEHDSHKGIQTLVKDLNKVYTSTPALHELDCDGNGFEWLVSDNSSESILVYLRKSAEGQALVVVNMTPSTYESYKVGVPIAGSYVECLNTDDSKYGGSNIKNVPVIESQKGTYNGQSHLIEISVPPLSTVVFDIQKA